MSDEAEYRVVWTDVWDTPLRRRTCAPFRSLEEAQEHRKYVAYGPHTTDVRIQVRVWQDVEEQT